MFSSGSVLVVSSVVSVEAAGSASSAVSAAYTLGIRLTTSIRIKRSEIHRLIRVGMIIPFKKIILAEVQQGLRLLVCC